MATAESPRTRLPPELTATQTLRPVRLLDEGVQAVEGRALFLVIEGTSSSSFELPALGTVIIGRAPDATLRLEDQSASRHHARVDLGPGGALLYDLESRNGTRVNGELLTGAHTLRAGDVVTLCSATLVFQRSEALAALRPIFGAAHLRQRLEEEIDRSLRYHRPVSVLCFHFAQPAAPAAVAGALRGMGAVAAGLVLVTALKLIGTLRGNRMGLLACGVIAAVTFAAIALARVPLVWVILCLGPLVCAFAWWRLRR